MLVKARWLFIFSFFEISTLFANPSPHSIPVRQYPIKDAHEVSVTTSIGITARSPFVSNESGLRWTVSGSRSGIHTGAIRLSNDRTTTIFQPVNGFETNEIVTVSLRAILTDGSSIADSFSFHTVLRTIRNGPASPALSVPPPPPELGWDLVTTIDKSPTPGRIYLTPTIPPMGLAILDVHGSILDSMVSAGINLLPQSNGLFTYFEPEHALYIALDSSLHPLDTFQCANGYETDAHEFLILPDGGYTLLGITQTTMDMTQHVAGGSPSATIQGNVLQRFDKSGNLIFEWRGIDHYNVEDVLGQDLTGILIDFQHANSIDVDSLGNYLLSNRHLEVTKIDGSTGSMLWRFGGKHNQFAFTNDTLGFSYQHTARFLPNGHILLFDNGNLHPVPASRAVEYVLDTSAHTATLVWHFRHDPPLFGSACGSAQRLPNGNTFIGWGSQAPPPPPALPMDPMPILSEVTPEGTVVFEMTMPSPGFSYRAIKDPDPPVIPQQSVSPTRSPEAELAVSYTEHEITVSFRSVHDESVTLGICDLLGNIVSSYQGWSGSNVRSHSFPVSGLRNGTYYVVLRSESGIAVQPVHIRE
jgi:hypothetical protein